jgi:hypothetical protein
MDGLKEDIGALKEGMSWIKAELSGLREDVKALDQFKWRIAGGAAVLGVLLGSIGSFVSKLLESH